MPPVHGTPGTSTQIYASSTGASTNQLKFEVFSVGVCRTRTGTNVQSSGPPTWSYFTTLDFLTSGTCVVTVTQGGDANYLQAPNVTESIPVDKGDLTVEANDVTMTYGDASVPTAFGATVTGFTGTDDLTSIGGTLTCTPGVTPSSTTPAGNYPITCSGLSTIDYHLVYETGTLAVEKAPLTVAPAAASIGLGDPIPTFTPTITGFVNAEGLGDLDTTPTCTPAVSVSTAAGIFVVECDGGADGNYGFEYDTTFLTIEMVDVVATFGGSMPFGGTPTFVVTPDVALPTRVTLTGTLTCTALDDGTPIDGTLPMGSYGVDPATCSGMAMSDPLNYRLVLSHGYVNVSQSFPTLSWATPANITYGTPLGAGQLNATANRGVKHGLPLAGTFTYSIPAGTVLPVLTGANLTAYFTPDDTANYASTAISVTLDVDPAVLVTTPNNLTIVSGQPINITRSITGFVNGDGPSALNGQPFCQANGVTGFGTFTITCSGGSAADYTFDNAATATLTITQAHSVIALQQGPPGGPVTVGAPVTFQAFVSVQAPGSGVGCQSCLQACEECETHRGTSMINFDLSNGARPSLGGLRLLALRRTYLRAGLPGGRDQERRGRRCRIRP